MIALVLALTIKTVLMLVLVIKSMLVLETLLKTMIVLVLVIPLGRTIMNNARPRACTRAQANDRSQACPSACPSARSRAQANARVQELPKQPHSNSKLS